MPDPLQRARLCLVGGLLLANHLAAAEPPDAGGSPEERPSMCVAPARRTRVRLLIVAEGGQAKRDVLLALLEAELRDTPIELGLETAPADTRAFIERARHEPGALLAAVLRTQRRERWELVVIDPARDRAIVRHLPGGLEQDAAALEAVASILVSAITALRDGLEVASRPVEEVVAPAAPPATPAGPATSPAAHDPIDVDRAVPPWTVRSTVAASAVTFVEQAPITLGLSASLGLTWRSTWSWRAVVGRHLPARIETDFGAFRAERTFIGVGTGPSLQLSSFELEPELRLLLELVQRTDAEPADGVAQRDDALLPRLGLLVGGRVRYRLAAPLAIEASLGGAYFPRRLRFVTGPETYELATPWPFAAAAEIGFEVRAP